ncbi:hypothetical protein KGM_214904B, partial [Danaus plexippus plexippus]
ASPSNPLDVKLRHHPSRDSGVLSFYWNLEDRGRN